MWFLIACSQPPAPEPVTEVVTVATSEVSAEDFNALQDRMDAKVNALEERIGNLELQLAEERAQKLADADQVAFDPSRTTLEGKDVQDALTEVAQDLARLEGKSVNMGEPGEKLFEIKLDHPEGTPQGGQGGQGGPGGPGGPGGKGGKAPGGPGGQH